jgi:hypothetical protein
VCFVAGKLLVAGPDRVCKYGEVFSEEDPILDPWIAGTHVVSAADDGSAWVSCAPANALVRFDPASNAILEKLPLPDYGWPPYPLHPTDDLRTHFINLDYQATHVNGVFAQGDLVFVSQLIQGVVGRFDKEREYQEVVSGYRALHGVRIREGIDTLYFSDSTVGTVNFIDMSRGTLIRRVDFKSQWLHDCQEVDGLLLGMVSDSNTIAVRDLESGQLLLEVNCDSLGSTVLFCSQVDGIASWIEEGMYSKPSILEKDGRPCRLIRDFIADLTTGGQSISYRDSKCSVGVAIRKSDQAHSEYLLALDDLKLPAGSYALRIETQLKSGCISIGLQDATRAEWLGQATLDGIRWHSIVYVDLRRTTRVRVVVAAANGESPGGIDASLTRLELLRTDETR